MSADLARVDAGDLDTTDPQAAALMVTKALEESRSWLAVAMKGTDPTPIAEFKAWAATIAEATRQKHLGREIELDAAEMVRRAERGIGVAIRNGQDAGEIRKNGGNTRCLTETSGLSPTRFFRNRRENVDTYAMTDGVSDGQFEDALAEAKAEGNLRRANVVRKIKPTEPVRDRPDILYKTRRLDSNRIVDQTVRSVEHVDVLLDEVDYSALDRDRLGEWLSSLSESIRALRSLRNTLEKELNRG